MRADIHGCDAHGNAGVERRPELGVLRALETHFQSPTMTCVRHLTGANPKPKRKANPPTQQAAAQQVGLSESEAVRWVLPCCIKSGDLAYPVCPSGRWPPPGLCHSAMATLRWVVAAAAAFPRRFRPRSAAGSVPLTGTGSGCALLELPGPAARRAGQDRALSHRTCSQREQLQTRAVGRSPVGWVGLACPEAPPPREAETSAAAACALTVRDSSLSAKPISCSTCSSPANLNGVLHSAQPHQLRMFCRHAEQQELDSLCSGRHPETCWGVGMRRGVSKVQGLTHQSQSARPSSPW